MCSSFTHTVLTLLFISFPPVHSVAATNDNQHFNNSVGQSESMLSPEAETLFNIMEAMSSDQTWRASYPSPCKSTSSWPGIECKIGEDKHLHVSRLAFGSPPNPRCRSTATFPHQIFDLSHLKSVFFFRCFVYSKTTISVAANRASNSSLQQLSLISNTALVGPIPPQISSLGSLQVLTLSQNHLTGQIPAEIFNLSSLLHLDFSYNFLRGAIPYQVGNLENLVVLDLSYNSLIGSIPRAIGQLGMLQKLDLSSNWLSGRIPESIEKLSLLVFSALSSNRLGGKLPKGLEKLQNLEYFIMDDNPMFRPLPLEFGKLMKLQELRLANSGYSGRIPPSLSKCLNLTTLSLQNNRLTGEIPVGLSNLSHIYHLNLSRNMLGGVVPFNASFLNRLGRNLDLSGNPELCLNASGGDEVKIGVGVCGSNKSRSLVQPLKKSESAPLFIKPLFLFYAFTVLSQLQILFLA